MTCFVWALVHSNAGKYSDCGHIVVVVAIAPVIIPAKSAGSLRTGTLAFCLCIPSLLAQPCRVSVTGSGWRPVQIWIKWKAVGSPGEGRKAMAFPSSAWIEPSGCVLL